MTTTLAVITIFLACVALFVSGWMLGKEDDRTRERAWCEGFDAGLKKADEMWPTVVRRWEMR